MKDDKTVVLIISAIVILGFGGVLIGWMLFPPSKDASPLLAALTTALGTGYLRVIEYYFGKSKDQ
jgi:hypothetical protein